MPVSLKAMWGSLAIWMLVKNKKKIIWLLTNKPFKILLGK